MKNSRYHTKRYKLLQSAKNDSLYGAVEEHKKICVVCEKEFIWKGRLKTKAFSRAKFCTRSCANNRQTWWKINSTHYRTIALQHWKKECTICGFDKIVAIHHIDENKKNNDPNNLMPLCPNHHEMIHSKKWKAEIQEIVDQKIKERRSVS